MRKGSPWVLFHDVMSCIVAGKSQVSGEPYLNASISRRLVQCSLHTASEIFYRNSVEASNNIETWFGIDHDNGAAFFFHMTKAQSWAPPYETRAGTATYMAGNSVKMQYLCGIFANICVDEDGEIVLFVDWSWNLWVLEGRSEPASERMGLISGFLAWWGGDPVRSISISVEVVTTGVSMVLLWYMRSM